MPGTLGNRGPHLITVMQDVGIPAKLFSKSLRAKPNLTSTTVVAKPNLIWSLYPS